MSMIRVGVLRGGPSREYDVSLQTGQSVLTYLPEHYKAHDILITKDGVWHWQGIPTTPDKVAGQVDVFFNALHGEYGEDGRLQNILDQLGTPYTGSGTFASAVGMNKELAKEVFRRQGLKVPQGLRIGRQEEGNQARKIFEKISPPWIVKPLASGSSVGLFFARAYPELVRAIKKSLEISPNILVEEYIRGREATCGVVDNFRGQRYYALPAIEIRKPGGKQVWDYTDKYSGETEEICPGNFTPEEKRSLEEMTIKAHDALGLRHYSRSDFILSPRGIYVLETNTLPGMTAESLLPKALAAVGCKYPDFLDHVIRLALEKK